MSLPESLHLPGSRQNQSICLYRAHLDWSACCSCSPLRNQHFHKHCMQNVAKTCQIKGSKPSKKQFVSVCILVRHVHLHIYCRFVLYMHGNFFSLHELLGVTLTWRLRQQCWARWSWGDLLWAFSSLWRRWQSQRWSSRRVVTRLCSWAALFLDYPRNNDPFWSSLQMETMSCMEEDT